MLHSVSLVGAVAAALGAQAMETAKQEQPAAQQLRRAKLTFSNMSRALFVAGLEGTGHHLFRSLAEECAPKDLCIANKESMCMLYNNTPKSPYPEDTVFNSHSSPTTFILQRRRCVCEPVRSGVVDWCTLACRPQALTSWL